MTPTVQTEHCDLYHGDALEIIPQLEAGSFDAIITDPPYSSGGAFRGDRTQRTVAKYVQSGAIDTCRLDFTGDNRDQRSFLAWASLWLCAARHACNDGAVLCSFIDWRQLPTLTDAIQAGGWVWRNLATWYKPGIRMQKGRFSGSAEYIVYATNGPHDANDAAGSPQNVFSCAPIQGDEKDHVAEKPIRVVEWLLQTTRPGARVLDPFMGSGVVAEACIKTGRKFVGIEIDRRSFDVACARAEGVGSLFDPTRDKETASMFAET